MITEQLRSRVDILWQEFWTGGINNPLTVIKQFCFLMFSRLLDMRESTEEKCWKRTNKEKEFFVPKSEIAENKYDVSLNRYKEIVHEEVKYNPPMKILARHEKAETEIAVDLDELERMLG